MKQAVFAAITVLIAIIGFGQAQAAPTIIGTYYEEVVLHECGTSPSPSCSLTYSVTPSDKTLSITNVSCRTQTINAPITSLYLTSPQANPNVNRSIYLPTPTLTWYQKYYLSFSAPVNFRVGPSSQLQIAAEIGQGFTLGFAECTIIGNLS